MHGPNDIATIYAQLASLTKQVGALNQQQQQPPEKKISLEIIMEKLVTNTKAFMAQTRSFMAKTETKIEMKKPSSKIKRHPYNMKVQVGKIINLLFSRAQGSLTSNSEKNLKEQAHAITLRSDKELEQVQKSYVEAVNQKHLIRESKESQRNMSPRNEK